LTDKDGNFRIPSYTTFIQPFSWQIPTLFIIFKPGYASLELGKSYFTGEETRAQEWDWSWKKDLKFRLHGSGIVELPNVRTREERINSLPSIPGPGIPANSMRTLIKLSNEERISLGLKPEEWP
jgi:hypothetical protein